MKLPEITIPVGQIDDYLKNYRYPCRFILQAGNYTTRGIWNFFPNFDGCMLPPGSELIGQGSNLTSLNLSNTVNFVNNKPTKYHCVLTGGNRSEGSNVKPSIYNRISGLTLDCKTNLPVIGIQTWSSNVFIEDVIVNNIWGDWTSLWEGFGILLNNSGNNNGVDGGHTIRDCVVNILENAYANGIYVGCKLRDNAILQSSVVTNCKSLCYGNVKNAGVGFGINSNTILNFIEVNGFKNALFNDTGTTKNVLVTNSHFKNISYGFLVLRANSTGWDRKNIIVNNCNIQFANATSDHVALLICDDTSQTKDKAKIQNIFVNDSIVENDSGVTFYYGSINGSLFSNIGIQRNILPKTNAGVVIASPASSSMWIDNQNILQ